MKRSQWISISCAAVFAVVSILWLDGLVADWFAKPISSGQAKAALQAMRTWGEGTTILVVAVALVFARPADWRRPVILVVAVLLVSVVVSESKLLFGRMRPDQVRDAGLPGAWQEGVGRNSSFPSGHVATAFAFARGLAAMYPAITPVCLVAASGTAASRMYDQRHYLSDCVAGAVLGWSLTPLALAALARLFLIAPSPEKAHPWRSRRKDLWPSSARPGIIES